MLKKQKVGKNKKSSSVNVEKLKLIEADLDGQVYSIIEKALYDRYFIVNCLDNTKRSCIVRKKRIKVKEGDCVIVVLRDFDDSNADIINTILLRLVVRHFILCLDIINDYNIINYNMLDLYIKPAIYLVLIIANLI